MPKITVTDEDGNEILAFNAEIGLTLMENLRNHDVEGILALCGGQCACGTCQIYLDASSYAKVGAPDEVEADVIEGSGLAKPTSRLSCQIRVTEELGALRFAAAPSE